MNLTETKPVLLASEKNGRLVLLDKLRGYACLLVLFGHVLRGLREAGVVLPSPLAFAESLLWTYHVALFFFLSGFTYSLTDGWRHNKTRRGFLLHKLLNLGVPYVVFSALYIFVNCLIPGVNTKLAFSDILWLWKAPVAQYWYLYALFIIFALWAAVSPPVKPIVAAVGFAAVSAAAELSRIDLGVISDYVLGGLFAFSLGVCVPRKLLESKSRLFMLPVATAVHLTAVYAALVLKIENLMGVRELLAAIGIVSSVILVGSLESLKPVSRLLSFAGKYCMPVYLLHTMFTSAVRILLLKLGVSSALVHVLTASVIGFFGPYAVAVCAGRFPALDFFFYPSKSIKLIGSRCADT